MHGLNLSFAFWAFKWNRFSFRVKFQIMSNKNSNQRKIIYKRIFICTGKKSWEMFVKVKVFEFSKRQNITGACWCKMHIVCYIHTRCPMHLLLWTSYSNLPLLSFCSFCFFLIYFLIFHSTRIDFRLISFRT